MVSVQFILARTTMRIIYREVFFYEATIHGYMSMDQFSPEQGPMSFPCRVGQKFTRTSPVAP
jgi:hypothetical protein